MKRPPCRPTAAVGGAGPPGAAVGPGQDGHHVHALPGALQRPDAPPPPLPSLRLRESSPPAPVRLPLLCLRLPGSGPLWPPCQLCRPEPMQPGGAGRYLWPRVVSGLVWTSRCPLATQGLLRSPFCTWGNGAHRGERRCSRHSPKPARCVHPSSPRFLRALDPAPGHGLPFQVGRANSAPLRPCTHHRTSPTPVLPSE